MEPGIERSAHVDGDEFLMDVARRERCLSCRNEPRRLAVAKLESKSGLSQLTYAGAGVVCQLERFDKEDEVWAVCRCALKDEVQAR